MAKQVIMQVSIAGMNFAYHPNQLVELDSATADAWIAVGHAIPVGGDEDGQTDDSGSEPVVDRTNLSKRGKSSSKS